MRRVGTAPRATARESHLSGVRTKRDGSRDGWEGHIARRAHDHTGGGRGDQSVTSDVYVAIRMPPTLVWSGGL